MGEGELYIIKLNKYIYLFHRGRDFPTLILKKVDHIIWLQLNSIPTTLSDQRLFY